MPHKASLKWQKYIETILHKYILFMETFLPAHELNQRKGAMRWLNLQQKRAQKCPDIFYQKEKPNICIIFQFEFQQTTLENNERNELVYEILCCRRIQFILFFRLP